MTIIDWLLIEGHQGSFTLKFDVTPGKENEIRILIDDLIQELKDELEGKELLKQLLIDANKINRQVKQIQYHEKYC